MPETRVSAIAHYAEEGNPNPVLVARDEHGVWKPVDHPVLCNGKYISEQLKDVGWVLVMETEE